MKTVVITGESGMLGSRCAQILTDTYSIVGLNSSTMDVRNREAVFDTLSKIDFDYLIHFAAYTNVDAAEKEPEPAYELNVTATKHINECVTHLKKRLILISTDFVFDGISPPFTEQSPTHPISVYGKTKWEAEQIVSGNAMIVRTSYPYRASFAQKRDIVRTIRDLLVEGKTLNLVSDSLMVPTFVDDIANALNMLMQNYTPDIFHVVGPEAMSPFELGKRITQYYSLDENLIKPVSYEDYFRGKARRPQFCDIRASQNIKKCMHSLSESLAIMSRQI